MKYIVNLNSTVEDYAKLDSSDFALVQEASDYMFAVKLLTDDLQTIENLIDRSQDSIDKIIEKSTSFTENYAIKQDNTLTTVITNDERKELAQLKKSMKSLLNKIYDISRTTNIILSNHCTKEE